MVRHVDEKDMYRRGCNDGTTFVLGLVLLCTIVALVLVNYAAAWPVFFPVLSICVAVLNMSAFSAFPVYRFKHNNAIVLFIVLHAFCVIAGVVFLGLLVANTSLFLSADCEGCSLSWAQRTTDDVCNRAMGECRGQAKYRFAIFAMFPTGAGLFIMEMVNLITAAIALIYLRKEKK